MKKPKSWLIYIILILTNSLIGCSSNVRDTIDLASDTAWELSIDDGPWRSIKVPGGGYNSDLQNPPLIDQEEVKDHVTYRRSITIPEFEKGDVVKISFGGVNHGCEVYLNDTFAGEHVGPMMPFDVDITDYVRPGENYELKVISYPQWHYDYSVPHGFVYDESRKHPDTKPERASETGWASKFSYGITKYISLTVLPGVYIRDIYIQTSVTDNTLKYDIWIHNHTERQIELTVRSILTSWNEDEWEYPEFDPVNVILNPEEEKKVTVGPVSWNPGMESYWWPNKPFREEYRAKLHNLEVSLYNRTRLIDTRIQRFGFVEWTEGSNYYMVNGVRINQISDGTPESAMSEYDCYSVSPAFLQPTDSTSGCPETWKRYMRLGISTNRIHQSTPTEYMMDAADETGFILIPETGIRGCQTQNWHEAYLPKAVIEMAQVCRNHPSVCRYSLQNEANPEWIPVLIDAIRKADYMRPLVFEDNQINIPARIDGKTGHAYAMLHYVGYPKPATIITGMGEYAWHWADRSRWGTVLPGAEGGLEEFVYYGGDMRRWDITYFAGWDFINYWPNFPERMNFTKHAWKQSCYPKDRTDNVDGWNSPVVNWMKKYFHPYLVMDIGIHEMNGPESDLSGWPEFTPSYSSGELIERNLEVFNDGLKGNQFVIKWEIQWDSADGEPVDSGIIDNIKIEPGFHQTVKLNFTSPETEIQSRKLYVLLKSELEGKEVFVEDELYFNILTK